MTGTTPDGRIWSVLVFDMARTGEPDGERIVSGFDSLAAASAYAEARMRASVEELRGRGTSADELRRLWHIYGEDCVVLGEPRDDGRLDRCIAEPAGAQDCDWASLAPKRP